MISYKEAVKRFGSEYLLLKALNNGKIRKVKRGYYLLENDTSVHTDSVSYICQKYPDAILTMDSAFYFLNLTDVIPDKIHLATLRNATRIREENVHQYFESIKYYGVGKDIFMYENTPVAIYNKERMLIELIRHKSTMAYDYYKEILLNYRKSVDSISMNRLEDYLEAFESSRNYFEVLEREVF